MSDDALPPKGGNRGLAIAIMLLVVAAVVTFVVVWWLTRPAGDRDTDRAARVMTDAVSYPRQSSAAGFLAAVNAEVGGGRGFTVVEARDLPAPSLSDPRAELIYHIQADIQPTYWFGFDHVRHVSACYRATFTYYGGVSERIDCPSDLTPVTSVPVRPLNPAEQPVPESGVCYSGSNDCPGG